jgi:hypothetical protein
LSASEAPNPGRHHLGAPGDIISECPGDFVGIRTPEVSAGVKDGDQVILNPPGGIGEGWVVNAQPLAAPNG